MKTWEWILLCIFSLIFGIFLGMNHELFQPDPTFEIVTKSITVEKLLTSNDLDAMGRSVFSGFVVVTTEGIGYWTGSDAMFAAFEIGKTYCVSMQPNLPQGPIINQNFGIGECK